MEKRANSALNFGLGILRSLEGQFAELAEKIEKGYADLVAKGAADQSESAVHLRSMLDRGVSRARDIQSKLEASVKK